MSIQFPDAPFQGQSFVATNGVSYTYDNGGWIANSQSALDDRYVNLNGDTMTGDLTVPNLTSEGDIQSTSQNGGPLAGFRNQLINGDFRVWQRGTAGGTSTGENYKSADRWSLSNSSSGVTLNRRSSAPAGFDGSTGISNGATIKQKIEAWQIFVAGNTWTTSLIATAPGLTVRIVNDDGGFDSGQLALTQGELVPTGHGAETWYKFYVSYTPLGNATAENSYPYVALEITNPTGSQIALNGVQLEPGPLATEFEHRPIATEFTLCQRYYVAGEAYVRAAPQGSTRNGCSIFFPTFMRTAPTTGASTKSGFGNTLAIDYVTNTGMVGSGNPNAVGELFFSYNADAEL